MNANPPDSLSPGEVLENMMKDRGWTQVDLARILGKAQPSISQLITNGTSITPETAWALSEAFGNDPAFWMEVEGRYRLSKVAAPDSAVKERARLYGIAPIKSMEKRGWIRKTSDLRALARELQRFFGTKDLESIPDVCGCTKKTASVTPLTSEQRAWCFRVKTLACSLRARKFTEAEFEKGITELRKLAAWPQETRKVPRVLAEMGIRFIVVEPLPRTRIDGATLWVGDYSPVVAVSVRYDRIDSFWHTLGHELSHVRHHDGLQMDTDIVGENRPSPAEMGAIERRADGEAASFILDENELKDFIVRVGPLYSRARINQFANRIRIHPGIIVGQLQYRGELSYAQLRDTLVKVREAVTSESLTDGWGHMITS